MKQPKCTIYTISLALSLLGVLYSGQKVTFVIPIVVLSHLANGTGESIMSFNKYEGYRNSQQRPINRRCAR
jgi:hypothetical protein